MNSKKKIHHLYDVKDLKKTFFVLTGERPSKSLVDHFLKFKNSFNLTPEEERYLLLYLLGITHFKTKKATKKLTEILGHIALSTNQIRLAQRKKRTEVRWLFAGIFGMQFVILIAVIFF